MLWMEGKPKPAGPAGLGVFICSAADVECEGWTLSPSSMGLGWVKSDSDKAVVYPHLKFERLKNDQQCKYAPPP